MLLPRKTLKYAARKRRGREAAPKQNPTSAMPSKRRRKGDRRNQNLTFRPLKVTAAADVFTQVVRSF